METYKATMKLTEEEIVLLANACIHYVATFKRIGEKTPKTEELAKKLIRKINEINNGPF